MRMINFVLILFALTITNCNQSNNKNLESNMDKQTKTTLEVVNKFNEVFNLHNVDSIMAFMTDECIFENTRPAPDGERFVGDEAVRKFWEEMFRRSPKARFTVEEIFAVGDRCVIRWIYNWVKEGKSGHVRGVDIIRVKDGKIAEKFSYVKG